MGKWKKEKAEKRKPAKELIAELGVRIDDRFKGVETSAAESLEQMRVLDKTVRGLESMLQSKLDRLFNQMSLSRRIAVFIDGQNLEGTLLKTFPGMRTNFGKMLEIFSRYGTCLAVRAYYAEEVSDGDPDRKARIDRRRSFFRALEGLGYYVYAKTKKLLSRNDGSVVGKANCDVEIATDMTELVDTGRFDAVILVSGDSDYAYLLKKMRERGIYTIVLFTEEGLSIEIRDECDEFVSLNQIAKEVIGERPTNNSTGKSA